MTTHARRFASGPTRTASATWRAIADVISSDSERPTFAAAQNAAAILIADEVTKTEPIVITGIGPRLHIYTVHGDDAVNNHNVNETTVPNLQFSDAWTIYLPDHPNEPGLVDPLVNDTHIIVGSAPIAEESSPTDSSRSRIGNLDLSAMEAR